MDLTNYLNPTLIASLQTGWYIFMLGLMIVEWPIVTFIAAFLASLGIFNIWIVWSIGWLGDILGDLLFYSIGRFGFAIFEKKTTVHTEDEFVLIGKLNLLIQKNLALAMLAIKFTPYAPPIGLTYIGKVWVKAKKYIFYSAVLSIPIPLLTSLVGFHLGRVNTLLSKYSGMELLISFTWITGIVLCSLFIFYLLQRKSAIILKEAPIFLKIEKNTKSDEKWHEGESKRELQ